MITEKELKDKCMPLIQAGRYAEAKNIMQAYRLEKNDHWSTGNVPLDLSNNLYMIQFLQHNKHPRLMALDQETYKYVFDLVAYALLRGSGTPRSSKMTNIPGMTIGTAAKVLMNYALTQLSLKEYRESDVVVSVNVTGGGQPLCPNCQSVCGTYPKNAYVPMIPNPTCKNPEFCNLMYTAETIGSPKAKGQQKQTQKKKSILDIFK